MLIARRTAMEEEEEGDARLKFARLNLFSHWQVSLGLSTGLTVRLSINPEHHMVWAVFGSDIFVSTSLISFRHISAL